MSGAGASAAVPPSSIMFSSEEDAAGTNRDANSNAPRGPIE